MINQESSLINPSRELSVSAVSVNGNGGEAGAEPMSATNLESESLTSMSPITRGKFV